MADYPLFIFSNMDTGSNADWYPYALYRRPQHPKYCLQMSPLAVWIQIPQNLSCLPSWTGAGKIG